MVYQSPKELASSDVKVEFLSQFQYWLSWLQLNYFLNLKKYYIQLRASILK